MNRNSFKLCSSICRECKFLDWEGSEDDQFEDMDGIGHIVHYDYLQCRCPGNNWAHGDPIIMRVAENNFYQVSDRHVGIITANCPYILEHTIRTEKQDGPTLAGLLEKALKKK